MGCNIHAYTKEGNTYKFAPFPYFNSLKYVFDGESFIQYSTPVRRLLVSIIGHHLHETVYNGGTYMFTPEQVGEVIIHMNANTCPVYMPQELYNNVLEFFSICHDHSFTVSIG